MSAGRARLPRAARLRARPGTLGLALLLGCGGTETYRAVGTVEDVDAAAGAVVIAHEDIPGLMPAMTMSFDVDPSLLEAIEPGTPVEFTLERSERTLRVTRLRSLGVAGVSGGSSRAGSLAAGGRLEVAPLFDLVDQDGERLSLETLRSKAVLLDFVFTRCPGPCPILTSSHVSLQRLLPEPTRARTHLVSITIDPEHDTPSELRSYALSRGADLETWSFLTGEPDAIARIVASYYVGVFPAEGALDHTIATFLIDPAGHIAQRYLGLEHVPEDILADIHAVLE